MNLKNKVTLITGGGTGIGRATCLALAEGGAIIAVNYSRSKTDAEETKQIIICAALEQEAMTGQIITVDSRQTL